MFASSFIKKLILVFVVAIVTLGSYYVVRTHRAISLGYVKEGVPSTDEWVVSFGQDVVVVSAQITPTVKGSWYTHKGFFGISALGFKPESGFEKGRTYTASVVVARTSSQSTPVELPNIFFAVAPAPGIISFSVDVNKEKASPRPVVDLVVVPNLVEKKLTLSIAGYDAVFEEISREGSRRTWRPTKDFPQGKHLTIQIRDEHNALLVEKNFETVKEPTIVNFFAKEPVLPGDTMIMEFNAPMQASSSPVILNIPGHGAWLDSRRYEYTVDSVLPNTTYIAKLPLGVLSEEGGVVATELIYHISSPSNVTPSFAAVPRERSIYGPIEVSFDQPVDHESAERAFRISPSVKGAFSWQEEKLVFTPSRLSNQRTYAVSMMPGVKAKFGLPSRERVSTSFSTAPEVYKLNVPYFAQQYSRSCEAASLRMALAYHGVYTNDMDILNKLGYNPRPKDAENNTWDDPRTMFVGYASNKSGEGYGVYGGPVARVAEDFGRTATYTRSITPQLLAKSIKAGDPVVLWGYTSLAVPKTSWRVEGGGEVTALAGEHARVVVGVYGSAENPIGFYLHDPINGKQYQYWDADDLMRHLRAVPGVTDQAVVVG